MRTTVTLDGDVEQQVRRIMRERGSGFKETINELIRRGLRSADSVVAYEPPVFSSGVRPGIDLDRATTLLGEFDDVEAIRKIEMGK